MNDILRKIFFTIFFSQSQMLHLVIIVITTVLLANSCESDIVLLTIDPVNNGCKNIYVLKVLVL